MTDRLKPGMDNKPAGQYIERGPRGGEVNNPRVVSINPGDRLPPTSQEGNTWEPKPGRPRKK